MENSTTDAMRAARQRAKGISGKPPVHSDTKKQEKNLFIRSSQDSESKEESSTKAPITPEPTFQTLSRVLCGFVPRKSQFFVQDSNRGIVSYHVQHLIKVSKKKTQLEQKVGIVSNQ